MGQIPTIDATHQLHLDAAGRVLIPVTLRRQYGLDAGDPVILEPSESGIVLRPMETVVREVQAFFADAATPEVRLSDELLDDRRKEAARERRD